MKSLVFIVEGESELELVNRLIIPYLISRGLNTSIQGIMITMSGGGHGYNNIEHLKNTIRPVMHRKDEPVITTMIDHYGVNSERKLPGYGDCVKETDVEKRLALMEEKLNNAVQEIKSYRYFIPYVQRHEFETLLFANPEEGFDLEEEVIKKDVMALCDTFGSIEDINCTPQGAPSKRLKDIYRKHNRRYEKGVDAIDIAQLTTIEAMLNKCPRFKEWLERVLLLTT